MNDLLAWSMSLRPGKIGSLRINSATTHPAPHMSTAVLYSLAPNSSSGARYHLVATLNQRYIPSHLTANASSTLPHIDKGNRNTWWLYCAFRRGRTASSAPSSPLLLSISASLLVGGVAVRWALPLKIVRANPKSANFSLQLESSSRLHFISLPVKGTGRGGVAAELALKDELLSTSQKN